MIEEAELAEGNVEEGTPGAEVGGTEAESDGDVRLDVEELRRRRGDGHRRKRVGAVVGGDAGCHGREKEKQRKVGSLGE